jgi:hypothetical protein
MLLGESRLTVVSPRKCRTLIQATGIIAFGMKGWDHLDQGHAEKDEERVSSEAFGDASKASSGEHRATMKGRGVHPDGLLAPAM